LKFTKPGASEPTQKTRIFKEGSISAVSSVLRGS